MAKTTPMQRTLAVIKKDGLKYWKVETLFNIIDVLVLDSGIVGVQVTGTDYKSHVKKIRDTEKVNSIAWLSQPCTKLQIWSWRKYLKKRGGKAKVWKAMIADVLIFGGSLSWLERT